ncbi:hypothetical protein RD792_002168 [Penstemon davidsonii]|uniref:Uncharacterized protein n=1 Tax=Penstemon davidsonii TaxID=160366 RepID=A0ABR0DR13_9LAMI|nr:hypothetical protein RD792_002168 [Penstemon davidsonii]
MFLQYVNHVLLHVLNVQFAEQRSQIEFLPLLDIAIDTFRNKGFVIVSPSNTCVFIFSKWQGLYNAIALEKESGKERVVEWEYLCICADKV